MVPKKEKKELPNVAVRKIAVEVDYCEENKAFSGLILLLTSSMATYVRNLNKANYQVLYQSSKLYYVLKNAKNIYCSSAQVFLYGEPQTRITHSCARQMYRPEKYRAVSTAG